MMRGNSGMPVATVVMALLDAVRLACTFLFAPLAGPAARAVFGWVKVP